MDILTVEYCRFCLALGPIDVPNKAKIYIKKLCTCYQTLQGANSDYTLDSDFIISNDLVTCFPCSNY